MAMQRATGLTYTDLAEFPDDNLRREIIDGELFVTAAPSYRHQSVVKRLLRFLDRYVEEHGGDVVVSPFDVFLSEVDVVQPDLLVVTTEKLERLEEAFLRGAPDIAIEVSSRSTRRLELIRKRDLYERYGVPEYWYVDLDADRIEVYRRSDEGFGRPLVLERSDELTPALLPGFSASVDHILGAPEG